MTPPCSKNPELWFTQGNDKAALDAKAEAARICRLCPMLDACRRLADDIDPQYGIWAGVNFNRQNPKIDRLTDEVLSHGTPAGAMRHRRRGENPCRSCLDAEQGRKWECEVAS